MGKNIGKNISKDLNRKYSLSPLDHAKQSATEAFKTGDLIGNKLVNKITKVSRSLPQNNSETVTNEHDEEIPKERYTCPEERQKIIDNLRLI